MNTLVFPTVLLATCVSLSAQPDHFTSSPRGFEFAEGDMSLDLIGSKSQLRFMQIDATNGPKTVAKLAFRRDGVLGDNLAYVARTVDMSIVMAESHVAGASAHMPGNYAGNQVTVLARKQVAFPDWTLAPAVAPASHNLEIPLDVVWVYAGKAATGNDMLWEVVVYGTSSTNSYPMDADQGFVANNVGFGQSLAPAGCVPTGGTMPSELFTDCYNWGTKMSLDMHVHSTVANAAGAIFLAAVDSNLSAPALLCSTLHAVPLASIPASTNGTGQAAISLDPIAYQAGFIGATFYSQAAFLDAGQPVSLKVALTDGNATKVPVNPPATPQVVHMYATSATAHHSTVGVQYGGIILHTNHP